MICDVWCMFSIIIVGIVWGATNPLIRKAAKRRENEKNNEKNGIFWQFFSAFLDFNFSIPFAINQLASIIFNILVVNLPVTIVVPIANAIQISTTSIVGYFLGEKINIKSTKQIFGIILIVISIFGMLIYQ